MLLPATLFSLLPFPKQCLFWWRLVAVALVLFVPVQAWSAPPQTGKGTPTDRLPIEQQYKIAKEYLARLDQENALGKDRNNWLTCVRSFQKIHTSERKNTLGPPSLFMVGKTYRRMFERFKVAQDLDTAQASFLEVADLYPGHALADDALYEAAECTKMIAGKEPTAAALYRKILAAYPQGDQVEKARTKIGISKPELDNQQPALSKEAPPPPPVHLTGLSPVKYWTSDDYCRIVIQPEGAVAYSAKLVDSDGSPLRRLAVDLAKSYVAPKIRQPLFVQNGLLKTVKSDQISGETARVLLELASLAEYKIFSLSDPFRVIIDIRGVTAQQEEKEASATEVKPEPQPNEQTATVLPDKNAPPQRPEADLPSSDVIRITEQKKHPPRDEPAAPAKEKSGDKLSLAQQLGLGVRKIVIDPGHGGKDPGAMAFGLKEKDVVLTIAKKVAKVLKESYHYEVVLTRTKDLFIPLEERTAIANTNKSDLFISIHTNAHADQSKNGIETYFLNLAPDANAMRIAALENATSTHSIGELQDILSTLMKNTKIDESTRLARFVQSNLVSGLNRTYKPRDLGVKQAPFYVLIGAQMPAILAEVSFITNPEEAKLLQNEQYLDKVAAQIAAGVAAYVDNHAAANRL